MTTTSPTPTTAVTTQAAVFKGDRQTEVREATLPEPNAGEVRIRLEGCGVCSSNLPTWQGRPWFDYPQQPGAGGHEGWGVVNAVGPDVHSVEPGNRVAALSHAAYAEYDVAPESRVVKLPESLDGAPFPGEPLGCAMNIFKRSEIQSGQRVAIVGVGFLGALLTQLAQAEGAHVIALSRRPFALEIARASGAEKAISLEDDGAEQQVMDWTGGEGCDCVIEATGKQEPLNLAAKLTKVRGRLVVAGYHQDGLREVNMQLWNWRGLDVINAHEREPEVYMDGIRAALDAVVSGRLDPSPLYTHTFRLDELSDAFHTLEKRPVGFMKAIIELGQ